MTLALRAFDGGSQAESSRTKYGYDEDGAGNLVRKGPLGSPLTLRYGGGYAGPHGVTEVVDAAEQELGSYSYSADGEVTFRSREGQPSLLLLRNDDGRIAQVNAAIEYRYDEAGERSRKTSAGAASDTLYVDREYEVDLANAKHQVHYFYGSRRVASRNRSGLGLPGNPGTNLSWQYYFPDFVGSNAVVARSDGEVQRSFFRPFGEFAQDGPALTPYLFTDQERDAETGLD